MLKTIADNNGKEWIIEYGGEISRRDYDEGGIYIPPPRHIPLPLFSILKNFNEFLIVYY